MQRENCESKALPKDVSILAGHMCQLALGRRLFPAGRRSLRLTYWPGRTFQEEQYPFSETWTLGRLCFDRQSWVVGTAYHWPSDRYFIDCQNSAIFIDRSTSACALARSILAWLELQEVTGGAVVFQNELGDPCRFHVAGLMDKSRYAINSAKETMFEWQRRSLERLSSEAGRGAYLQADSHYRPIASSGGSVA